MLVLTFTVVATPALAVNLDFMKDAPVVGMSDEDRELLRQAARQLLEEEEDGTVTSWSNPESDAHGRLKVSDTHEDYGTTCRMLAMHNRVEGREGRGVMRVCKKDDVWRFAPRRRSD